jgi:uncharacterized protein YbjT (DUF2867 family)
MDVMVAGATGRLGGPLAYHLIDHGHRVRALTRDPRSAAASRLRRGGAQVVAGDLDDPPSLRHAAAGADAVFVLSTPHYGTGPEAETRQAIALADAAVSAGAGLLVYASAAGAGQASVPMLASKRLVEEHLATLPVPHAVIAPAYFMDNLFYPWNMAVLQAGHWPIPLPPGQPVQLIPASDTALFAALVIEWPDEFAGRRIELASDEVTGPQAARILSEVLHRPIAHSQTVPGPLAPMAPFFQWLAEVGFHADIQQLRTRYPEVGWRSLPQWAAAQDWPARPEPEALRAASK